MRAGLCLALAILTQPALSRGYVMSRHWPTGMYERQFDMEPEDGPLCRALLDAFNHGAEHGPFTMCGLASLDGEGVVEAKWQPVHAADPFALYMRFEKAFVPNAVYNDADIADIKARLADGRYRFETVTMHDLPPLAGEVRLLRIVIGKCTSATSDGTDIVIAEDAGFDRLRPIERYYSPATVLGFQGRNYLLSMSYEAFDDSTTRKLIAPQPTVDVFRPDPYGVAKICRFRYRYR